MPDGFECPDGGMGANGPRGTAASSAVPVPGSVHGMNVNEQVDVSPGGEQKAEMGIWG